MNKKSRLLLVVMLLCSITMQLYGQTHTVKNSFKHKFTCELIDDIEVNYTAYYDYDDNEIYHGPFAAKYSNDININGVVGKLEYTSSGTYIEGKLDGELKITIAETFTRPKPFSINISLVASYKNGIPTGKWTASEAGKLDSESENYSITTLFENGEITSISTSKGSYVTFDLISTEQHFNDEIKIYSVSGKWGDKLYKNGINASGFRRKTGNYSELDDEVKAILNELETGNIATNELIDKGYITTNRESLTEDIFGHWENLLGIRGNRWISCGLDIYQYDNSQDGFKFRTGSMIERYKYYVETLHRVTISPTEKIMQTLKDKRINTYGLDELTKLYKSLEYNVIKDSEYNDLFYNNATKQILQDYVLIYIDRIKAMHQLYSNLKSTIHEIKVDATNNELFNKLTQNYIQKATTVLLKQDSVEMAQCVALGATIKKIANLCFSYNTNKINTIAALKSTNATLLPVFKNLVQRHQITNIPKTRDDFTNIDNILQTWNKEIDLFRETSACLETINAKDVQIKAFSDIGTTPVVKAYNVASIANSKAGNCKITSDINMSSKKIQDWINTQNKYIILCEQHKNIAENENAIINSSTPECKDVLKAYKSERKKISLIIDNDLNVCIDNANQLKALQNSCLDFIAERKKIASLNTKILAETKSYQNIRKVYTAYYKTLNLGWSPNSNTTELIEIEKTQELFLNAITSSHVVELDNDIMSLKDTSLQNIINMLESK